MQSVAVLEDKDKDKLPFDPSTMRFLQSRQSRPAALLSLAFFLIHMFSMVTAFEALELRDKRKWATVPILHLLASLLVSFAPQNVWPRETSLFLKLCRLASGKVMPVCCTRPMSANVLPSMFNAPFGACDANKDAAAQGLRSHHDLAGIRMNASKQCLTRVWYCTCIVHPVWNA